MMQKLENKTKKKNYQWREKALSDSSVVIKKVCKQKPLDSKRKGH